MSFNIIMSTDNNSSNSNNDTSSSQITAESAANSSDFRQRRATPFGPVYTEQSYPVMTERFEDHQNAYQAGKEQLAQERQQQQQKPEWPGRSVHRIWNENISWRLQTFALPAKREILERLSEHKYKIEHSAEYRSEFVKSLEEDRGDHYRGIMKALDEDIAINTAIRAEIGRCYTLIENDKKEKELEQRLQDLHQQIKNNAK
jgi:hypothetical protein